MSEEQSDKLKLNLKTTDTNRFKIEADQATGQPAEQLPKTEAKPAQIDELEAQRKVNTGNFKLVDVSGQSPASTTAVPGMGNGGLKKSETVRLKVVRATPAGAPAAGSAASTVKLNLKKPDEPVATSTPTPSPAQTSTLKLRPTTPAPAEQSAANTATVKVPMTNASATVAVEPPKEDKPAAATVAVEPPKEEKPVEEKKEEPPKPAMRMKGATKEDDLDKYLPQQDDDEPGALEGIAALIAFLGTGFATYQLVMNFLQQIQ